MKTLTNTFLLRFAVAVILLVHSVFGMFDGGINAFGNLYLNQIGFAPIGLYLAWAIKLSHVGSAVCFLLNKYLKLASIITIFILVMGIILIHFKEGWFVVGGGRNGMEYTLLLIFVLITLIFPDGFNNKFIDNQ